MFNKLFKKKDANQVNEDSSESTSDSPTLPFEMLILNYLMNYGINENGVSTGEKEKLTQEDIDWIEMTTKAAGFYEGNSIEKLVIEEWFQQKEINKNLTPKVFYKEFVRNYHNTKMEKYAPEYITERNKTIATAYSNLIGTIQRIQGWLKDEKLRTRIESDLIEKPYIKETIAQCATPFCLISLGCDGLGRYSIVYSVDYRFQEMISESFASTFIRRIYEFTPRGMEPFVRIGSLYQDCIELFNKLIEESKTQHFHHIKVEDKFEN